MQEPSPPAFRVSIVAIVLFLVAALFARSMLDVALRRNGMAPGVAHDLSYLVVPPILLVLMLPYLRRCGDALRRLFDVHRLTPRVVACSIALGLILRLMWWASNTFLIGVGFIRNDDPNAVVGPFIGWECPLLPTVALSLFTMAVVAPVTEEIVHRGFLLYGMLRHGRHLAVFCSAVLFALAHVVDSYGTALVGGLLLATQALNYRALWGPIVTHATYNAAAVFDWDCFSLVWNPPTSDPLLADLTRASVPLMLTGACLIALLTRQKAAGAARPPRPKQVRTRGRSPPVR